MDKEQDNKLDYKWGIILILILAIMVSIKSCKDSKTELSNNEALIKSLNDTVKIWKDKKGLSHSERSVIQTTNPKTFINGNFKDPEIKALQEEVKKYKEVLGKTGSVTQIETITVFDTVYVSKFKSYGKYLWKDDIENKWITMNYDVDTLKKVNFRLKVTNEYSVVNKEKSLGLFKKPILYTEVTNLNPYSYTPKVLTYKVDNQIKPKKFGLGIQFGYGIGSSLLPSPYIGVGASYNVIRF